MNIVCLKLENVNSGICRTGHAERKRTQWDEVGKAVKAGAEELRLLTTHSELYSWAKEHKFATASVFPKFKTELSKRLDIDYDELRSAA